MANTHPSYLFKRAQIWYFRQRTPRHLVAYIGKTEFKVSLKTQDVHVAKRRSIPLAFSLQQYFSKHEKEFMTKKVHDDEFAQILTINRLKVGDSEIEGLSFDSTPENEIEVLRKFQQLLSDYSNSVKTDDDSLKRIDDPSKTSILLSKAIEDFCALKKAEKSKGPTKGRTLKQFRGKVNRLIDVFGDIPVSAIKKNDARYYRLELMKLPSNVNKKGAYRELGVNNLLKAIEAGEISIPEEDILSPSTVKSYLECASTLFSDLVQNEYITTNPFAGVGSINKDEFMKDSEYRHIWEPEQLKTIFSGSQYSELKMWHPYYYWVPLICLFSGARLNEICQLYLDQLVIEDGNLFFKIEIDHPDQTLKNKHARRLIPVHSELKRLGFEDYVAELQSLNEQRLFPELTLSEQGYGKNASSWFGRYREDMGLKRKDKMQDFHSLRHNVADFFKQNDVSEVAASAILGHSDQGITYGRYAKDLQSSKLTSIIETLNFSEITSDIKRWDRKKAKITKQR